MIVYIIIVCLRFVVGWVWMSGLVGIGSWAGRDGKNLPPSPLWMIGRSWTGTLMLLLAFWFGWVLIWTSCLRFVWILGWFDIGMDGHWQVSGSVQDDGWRCVCVWLDWWTDTLYIWYIWYVILGLFVPPPAMFRHWWPWPVWMDLACGGVPCHVLQKNNTGFIIGCWRRWRAVTIAATHTYYTHHHHLGKWLVGWDFTFCCISSF